MVNPGAGTREALLDAPLVWGLRALAFPMLAAASPVQAETRVRLLIGDGSYANEVGRFGDPQKIIALALHIG